MEKGSAHEKTIRHLAYVRCDGDTFAPHDLDEHLHGVGKLAEEYAQVFGSRRFTERGRGYLLQSTP